MISLAILDQLKTFLHFWGHTKLGHLSDEKFCCDLEFSKCPYDMHIIPYEVPVIRRNNSFGVKLGHVLHTIKITLK